MFNYKFGMNDRNGRLIEISIPAKNLAKAIETLEEFLQGTEWDISDTWVNDVTEY